MKTSFFAIGLVVLLLAFLVIRNNAVPSGLGLTDGRLAPLPKTPNAVSSQTDDRGRYVKPLPYQGSLQQSKTALKEALSAYGNITIVTDRDKYIHAVATTGIMRFHDDLEFLFDATENVVHFRSASRVGYSDMGLNRQRYEALRALFLNARSAPSQ